MWLDINVALACLPLLFMVVVSYVLCRQTAIHVDKQRDVVKKIPDEHFEDIMVVLLMVCFVITCHPHLTRWPAIVTMPCASVIFAIVSDLPLLQSNLGSPSIALIVVLIIVSILLVLIVGFMGFSQPQALIPFACVLAVTGMYVGVVYAVAHLDHVTGNETVVHLHHWQIGLAIALAAGCFDSVPGIVLASIGLAVMVHGNSVYRLTSPFCGWRVPCSATKYSQVPSVPV